jgi:hypothetical protein
MIRKSCRAVLLPTADQVRPRPRNWEANEVERTVPIAAFASSVVDIAGQKVSFRGGPRRSATTAPDWRLRLNVPLLFRSDDATRWNLGTDRTKSQ